MKFLNVLSAIAIALVVAGCGGGGNSDSSSVANTPPTITQCPDGTTVPVTKGCQTVQSSGTLQGSIVSSNTLQQTGIIVPFDGTLDPASIKVVLWEGAVGGTSIAGTPSLGGNGRDVMFTTAIRLPLGKTYTEEITAKDTLGRAVAETVTFSTEAMVCADNITWSNPANFSPVFQNCLSDIGVQVQVSQSYNKLQDDSCVVTIGTPLAAACKAYMANGTMMLANTSIVVNSHAVMWMVYAGRDGKSNVVLLDVNDPTTPVPVAEFVTTSPLEWFISNPTGMFAHTADGKGSQITADKITCVLGC